MAAVAPPALDVAAFNDQAARAKSVLNLLFLLAMAAYPLTIGFTTAVRTGRMSVVSGRPPVLARSPSPPGGPPSPPPPPSGPDLWVSTDGLSLSMTVLSFFSVLVVHSILLGQILMRRREGAPEMKKSYAAAVPFLMCLITSTYYLNYLGLTRYGASPVEWAIFSVFTTVTIFMSIVLYAAPPKQNNVVVVAAAVA